MVGARLGQRHCSLCDITHGLFTEKSAWRDCESQLPVAFVTYHRNDQPDDVRTVTAGRLPAIVARTDDGVRMCVTSAELAACHGDPQALFELLTARLATN